MSDPVASLPEQTLGRRIVIQHSRLAGFRHHAAPRFWAALRGRTSLFLSREPDNPHDPDAVALHWRGHKLGYLPRGENFLVARLLDEQRCLSAQVERLSPNAEHDHRVALAVLLH
jgi:hypothetical protein